MSLLMLWDAIDLTYLVARTGVKGLYYGGKIAWDWTRGQPNQITDKEGIREEFELIEFTPAENHLLGAFRELPEWVRQTSLVTALFKHNSETLVNFCFGDKGSTVLLQFLDMRSMGAIAQLSILLDENKTVEDFRKELATYKGRITPDFSTSVWYIRLPQMDRNRFVSNSDNLSIFAQSLQDSKVNALPLVQVIVDF